MVLGGKLTEIKSLKYIGHRPDVWSFFEILKVKLTSSGHEAGFL